ncbi:MAG: DUF1566 domain-containing protein, partial [Deltaproteobacteria bacterium]|nr:DUF1566 domain-containing protein [Deltaproteobacteria bacterium]
CNSCDSGYTGYPTCVDDPCLPDPCNGHASSCDSGTGVCTCATGYTGAACNSCAAGYIGYPTCVDDPCDPDPCNGNGTCAAGVCTCNTGYTGAACDSCDVGYSGYPTCVPCGAYRQPCCASDVCAAGNTCNAAVCVADSCTGKDDFTWCKLVTAPDRSYDICVSATCVSPGCGDQTCNEPGPHFILPDTDQRACYDNSTTMTCTTFPCNADGTPDFCGQDWQYGWDTTHAQTARYTKTEPVAGEPLVADNITGLEWQGCPAELSGSSCTIGSVQAKTWAVALTYCEGLTWAGQTDWRLPDMYELRSIADYGRSSPAIDTTVFPATPSTYCWSSTSYAADASSAWYVNFDSGYVSSVAKANVNNVRCVRGGP